MKISDYPALTVSQLKRLCDDEIRKGNGDKKILISGDDEGNSYHGLFYDFIDDPEEIKVLTTLFDDKIDEFDKIVILG